MKNIIICIAVFCCLSSLAFAEERQLDSTLIVTKNGLTVIDNSAPIKFKCGREWSLVFTNNGGTITLRTQKGRWTLTGLRADIALAAVQESGPLIAAVAAAVGASPQDIPSIVATTQKVAGGLAKTIGTKAFDATLAKAVAFANDALDAEGIHPADYNDEILAIIDRLGHSGIVIDVSDVTVKEVHDNAQKVIQIILSALASIAH